MASMSLGRTIAPFTCGVMFESELWLSQDYNLTQADGWFGREARDPACYASNATELAALGCTAPDYFPEFQVIPTPLHVFCAFSPSRRGGSNEPQAGTQGQETVTMAPKHRFAGLS